MTTPSGKPPLEQLQQAQRERDELRRAVAAETAARRSDRAAARQSIDRAQDLDAELFRMRDQLKLARMEAEETYALVLNRERQLRALGEQREVELGELAQARVRCETSSAQLGQALALQQQHATHWQAELDQARQEATRSQAGLDQARHAHQQEAIRRQAELDQARHAHQQDSIDRARRTQVELDRARTHADASARILAQVLSSRSWRLTRVLRQIVEGVRGRRWVEPRPPSPDSAIGPGPRRDDHQERND